MLTKFGALLCFCLVTRPLSAFAPHPTVLTVRYDKGEVRAVVRVQGDTPYILNEGKIKQVRWTPKYILQRAEHFADNHVESLDGSLAGQVRQEGTGSGNARSYIELSLRTEKSIQRGFAVVVAFMGTRSGNPILWFTTINVHELPELPAGKPVRVKFSFAGGPPPAADYFIQIFDDQGLEVRTNDMKYCWQYYALRDLDRLAATLVEYLKTNQGADREASPFVMPKPLLTDGAILPKGEISALLTVTDSGQVSAVDVRGVENVDIRQNITEALEGWLFLPKLKAGMPVPVKVQVPLQF